MDSRAEVERKRVVQEHEREVEAMEARTREMGVEGAETCDEL